MAKYFCCWAKVLERATKKKKIIFWLLASPYILWLSGDRQLWCSITVELFHSFLCIVFFILDGPNYESRCDRSALRLLLSQGFREMRHCVACSPFLLKTHKPLNSNFATVQSKVMKLRYSLEDSSVSHPQPNLRYSTVGLPLHPRGCLLRACEAQWTEFQWAVSFFCLSVRTYRVHIYCKDLAQAEMLRCLFSSATSSVFHSLSTVCSLYFPSSAFVPLSLSFALCGLFFLFLPSLAVYKEECHAPIRWLVSLSQRCHYWNPTGLMLIYTHHRAPKQR